MSVTPADIVEIVERELAALSDERVRRHIRALLVAPESQMRPWDYGAPGAAYACWIVLSHQPSNTGIAYSEYGFGPKTPWGLVSLDDNGSMGSDAGWFGHFVDAYFDSRASTELPIWQVFRRRPGEPNGESISDEGSWDATWEAVMCLRSNEDGSIYECNQSIYMRKW